QRGDPAGVQGKAAVSVHAPAVPEDRVLSAQRGVARPRGFPPAEGFVGWVERSETHRRTHYSRLVGYGPSPVTHPTKIGLSETEMSKILDERDFAHVGSKATTLRADDVAASAALRKMYEQLPNVVSAEDMPWEKSADGLIKHLVHEKMDTRERCVEAYMQFLKPGERSGKHRHMWEEGLFVVEGSGYDLHWDLKFDCLDAFEWEWSAEPKKHEWTRGDFIYVPPFTIHQHFNAHATDEARLIVISNRMVKEMGFDWFDQI